jgi:hypothetical protein
MGGGALGSTLENCMLTANSAAYGGGAYDSKLGGCSVIANWGRFGGGAYSTAMTNCLVYGNSAGTGGGAYGGTMLNCTVTANSAAGPGGGGACSSTVINCIIYYNSATNALNYLSFSPTDINFCCTTPLPTNGFGNITDEPLFVDLAQVDLRLQSNSPCINAGNNAFAPAGLDLDGNPRVVGGIVDLGAYEFQNPRSIISYAWLEEFGLPTDGSADFEDPDQDGVNNWQEWRAGTNPTNAFSVLSMLGASNDAASVTVQWRSVSGIAYYLPRATNLHAQPAFSSIQSNIVGQAGMTSFKDTNALGAGSVFYRVGVQ